MTPLGNVMSSGMRSCTSMNAEGVRIGFESACLYEGVQFHFLPQDGDSERSSLETGSAYVCVSVLSD